MGPGQGGAAGRRQRPVGDGQGGVSVVRQSASGYLHCCFCWDGACAARGGSSHLRAILGGQAFASLSALKASSGVIVLPLHWRSVAIAEDRQCEFFWSRTTPSWPKAWRRQCAPPAGPWTCCTMARSEEHTSDLQSLMRISYAVFRLKKQNKRVVLHTRH